MVADMTKMRDSGIEGIDLVPEEWDRVQLEHCAYIIRGGSPRPIEQYMSDTNEGFSWIKIGDTEKGNKYISHVREKIISAGLSKTRYVKAGTLLLTNSMSFGEPYILKVNGCIHDGWLAFSNLRFVNKEFLYYFLVSPACRVQFEKASDGGVVQNLNIDKVKHSIIYFPNISKQQIIADYLDSKCAEIDALSADIQSEIETLEAYKRSVITEAVTKGLDKNVPMKESGIKWIGKMPANWDIVRGKFILKYLQKPVKEDDGVITCFRDGEVTLRSNRREEGFTMSDKEIGYQGIDVGDLVVHGMDGFAGSIGISDSRGKASPVLNVLDTDENKKYIMYYLRSMAYSDVFLALATGIRVRSCDLRWNKLAELFYPVPSKHEQDRIVQYIDDTLHQADEIIAQKKEQLSVLADYKKTVIYEYVTGKKEVPAV